MITTSMFKNTTETVRKWRKVQETASVEEEDEEEEEEEEEEEGLLPIERAIARTAAQFRLRSVCLSFDPSLSCAAGG
jgi:hypothetical protein